MQHLSIELHPCDHGLTPYHVSFRRSESHPLPCMWDEGIWFSHPERIETAIVWAKDSDAIPQVLMYHYQDTWSEPTVLPNDDPHGFVFPTRNTLIEKDRQARFEW